MMSDLSRIRTEENSCISNKHHLNTDTEVHTESDLRHDNSDKLDVISI